MTADEINKLAADLKAMIADETGITGGSIQAQVNRLRDAALDAERSAREAWRYADECKEAREATLAWIPVSERLPELRQPVAMFSTIRHECGFERQVYEAGYLENYGSRPFWSTRSESGIFDVDAMTHWTQLPIPPVPKQSEVK